MRVYRYNSYLICTWKHFICTYVYCIDHLKLRFNKLTNINMDLWIYTLWIVSIHKVGTPRNVIRPSWILSWWLDEKGNATTSNWLKNKQQLQQAIKILYLKLQRVVILLDEYLASSQTMFVMSKKPDDLFYS